MAHDFLHGQVINSEIMQTGSDEPSQRMPSPPIRPRFTGLRTRTKGRHEDKTYAESKPGTSS